MTKLQFGSLWLLVLVSSVTHTSNSVWIAFGISLILAIISLIKD